MNQFLFKNKSYILLNKTMACRSNNNKEKIEELTKKLNDIQGLEKVTVNLNGFEIAFEDGDWQSI
jgi:hypothetical protein